MDAEEIESYQYQLDQIELALASTTDEEEMEKLQKLRNDIKEVLALTQQYTAAATVTVPSPKTTAEESPKSRNPKSLTPQPTALKSSDFSIGQEVMARWKDGKFYRATISSIGGADQIFSVVFRGYKDTETVNAEDITALDKDKKRPKGVFEDIPKKKTKTTTTDAPPKTSPKPIKKAAEVEQRKKSWQNFSTSKKKKAPTSMPKRSIFTTPDNANSKVGVIGSGRGVTPYQVRGKHVYSAQQDQAEDEDK